MRINKRQILLSIVMFIMLLLPLFSFSMVSQAAGNMIIVQNTETKTEISQQKETAGEKEQENAGGIQGRSETRKGTEYIYDRLNRLIKVIYEDGTVVTYVYDKNGNLLETKVSPGTVTPTAAITPEGTISPTETVTLTVTSKVTETPTTIISPTVTGSLTVTISPTITMEPTVTLVPTVTLAPTVTTSPTVNPTPSIVPPTVTEFPYEENTIEVYYTNENWDKAYIHYKVGNGEWTQVPGKQMSTCNTQEGYQWKYVIELGEATEATICFNDGAGNWDSRNAQNYTVYEGRYGVKEGTVKKLETPVLTPTITETPYKENTVEVFYGNKNWTKAYIHYKTGNGEWTTVPGKQMSTCNTQEGYQWKYVIELGEAEEATICFNDGAGNWDSRNAQNYTVYEGRYGVKEGAVTKLEIPELTPVITQPPYTGNVVEVYYRNDGWNSAYIHYKAGDGEWTQVPGERMQETYEETGYRWKYLIYLGEAEEATVCFNNGNGSWDSQYGANYKVYKGFYGIKDGKVSRLKNILEIYYDNPDWSEVYIHYKIGNGSWTSVPGVKMSSSDRSGYQWKYTIDLENEENAEVCFNDGNGNWDSKNATNYIMYQGIYGIKNETVYELE